MSVGTCAFGGLTLWISHRPGTHVRLHMGFRYNMVWVHVRLCKTSLLAKTCCLSETHDTKLSRQMISLHFVESANLCPLSNRSLMNSKWRCRLCCFVVCCFFFSFAGWFPISLLAQDFILDYVRLAWRVPYPTVQKNRAHMHRDRVIIVVYFIPFRGDRLAYERVISLHPRVPVRAYARTT